MAKDVVRAPDPDEGPSFPLDDLGFTSMSFNPGVAKHFSAHSAIYRVRVPKGFPGAAVARHGKGTSTKMLDDEVEVILPRGTIFRVVARTKKAAYGKMVDVVPVLPD